MNNDELKNLIIYTGVYYQDNDLYRVRSQIWFKTFDNAQRLGIRVVVRNDGGLPQEMLDRIRAYPNITIVEKDTSKKNTLGSGRREALQKAIDIAKENNISNPVFLWTEPEKDDLITEKNLIPLVNEINTGANMVIPERGEKAWNELPKQQRWLEQRAEKIVQEKIMKSDERLDLWFGPKVLDSIGAGYFLEYNSGGDRVDLWDSLMVPVLEAQKGGAKVRSVPLDFSYDESQTAEGAEAKQEGIQTKRIEQYAQILKALGDPEWAKFFEKAQAELAKIRELDKNPSADAVALKELKKSVIKKFFWK